MKERAAAMFLHADVFHQKLVSEGGQPLRSRHTSFSSQNRQALCFAGKLVDLSCISLFSFDNHDRPIRHPSSLEG